MIFKNTKTLILELKRKSNLGKYTIPFKEGTSLWLIFVNINLNVYQSRDMVAQ